MAWGQSKEQIFSFPELSIGKKNPQITVEHFLAGEITPCDLSWERM